MAKISVEYATKDMIVEFFGEEPKYSQRSVAVIEDGMIVSIVGIKYSGGRALLFSNSLPYVKNNMKRYAKAAAKCMKMLWPYMKERPEIVSIADPFIEKADTFLEHYGFAKSEGGYSWRQ